MDGVLNINKPSGMTSHDVVQAVRRLLKEKRVGHTGTLDPIATGVLVLCIGRATRIARYLEAGEKEYQAIMRLGVTTETLDAEGRILETRPYQPPHPDQLLQVFNRWIGTIMQLPPVYSAVKVGGVPSYRLARQGKAETLKPREVTIHDIELTAYEDPFVSFTVKCSKGVYIRSLCADVGEALGPGGHLTGLVRTRSGRFTLDCAVSLGNLADAAASGAVERLLVPMDEALADFPELSVTEAESENILHGGRVPVQQRHSGEASATVFRIHDPSGRLIALGRSDGRELQPNLVFSKIFFHQSRG